MNSTGGFAKIVLGITLSISTFVMSIVLKAVESSIFAGEIEDNVSPRVVDLNDIASQIDMMSSILLMLIGLAGVGLFAAGVLQFIRETKSSAGSSVEDRMSRNEQERSEKSFQAESAIKREKVSLEKPSAGVFESIAKDLKS